MWSVDSHTKYRISCRTWIPFDERLFTPCDNVLVLRRRISLVEYYVSFLVAIVAAEGGRYVQHKRALFHTQFVCIL